MSHYKPYPTYKDSGAKWLGQVPEHWEVARIKWVAGLRKERRSDVSADNAYIGLEDVEATSGHYKPTEGNSRQTEDSTAGIFYESDVLYGKLRPYLRKALVANMDGACSTEFLVLMVKKTAPCWLQQWLLTPEVTHQIMAGCEGVKMPRADWEHVGSIEAAYPDREEQSKIMSTLDREISRIDGLIQKKKSFIELLKEKRQALITHAVTKGLDPGVKMKNSGVEWMRQVPEHWEVARIKWVAGLRKERRSDLSADNTYIGLKDVEATSGQYKPTEGNSRQTEDSTVGIFYKSDVLYGKLRPYLRKALVADMDGACSTEFLVLMANKASPCWLQQWLLTPEVTHQIMAGCGGAKMPRADWEHVGSIEAAYPDREEQSKIISTLDRETSRIDVIMKTTERSIALLKERRSAFITAAVTGQIDLRGE